MLKNNPNYRIIFIIFNKTYSNTLELLVQEILIVIPGKLSLPGKLRWKASAVKSKLNW